MPLCPLTKFEIQKHHQSEPKSNGVYLKKQFSFRVEYFPKEIRQFIKIIVTNIYRIHAYHSIMYEYFCIGFIDFMWKDKSLLEYANLFSPNEYKKNDKISNRF